MDNEKKFKLDELPNSGSEPDKMVLVPVKKKVPDPRIEKLKNLNDSEREEVLSERWIFDKKKRKWGWLVVLVLLFALSKSKILTDYHASKVRVAIPADPIFTSLLVQSEVEFMMKYPFILAIFIPFFFKFKGSTDDSFELTFSGITTVKTIHGAVFEAPTRVKLKWDDIKAVQKIQVKGRYVLEIHNSQGPAAELIWDIDEIKKKVVKQVLINLVSIKHPLRIFIEKEVT